MDQKLIFLVGAVCVFVIVAGGLSLNWDAPVTAPTGGNNTLTETSSNNETPSESAYDLGTSGVIAVTLNGDSIDVDTEIGVAIDGTKLTIMSAGNYCISGTLDDGQIIVDTNDNQTVTLILNGAKISSSTRAPLFVEDAQETVIVLADNTKNVLTDTQNNADNATLCSKDDLVICGNGALTVTGNANDAIRSNDGLVIEDGTITVTSVDDGIRGKDYLVINGGTITVTSVGDGLTSDNDEQQDLGYVSVTDGSITVVSTQGDAISAQTNLVVTGGTFMLTSGGGSNALPNDAISTKGLKAGVSLVVDGGDFVISSSDDAVHSNDVIVINDGVFDVASGDDAMHADNSVEFNGGTFDVSQSFEGIESSIVTINNGHIQIVSSDDAINLVEPTDDSPTTGIRPWGGMWGGGGMGVSENCYLYINGGTVFIDSGGDGLDSNGHIQMNDGIVIINGPTSNMNAAIDYGWGTFNITGGTLVAVGSSGMAQAPSPSSIQKSLSVKFVSQQSANMLVNIKNDSGEDILTFKPAKVYQSVVFSSPDLEAGTYNVYIGGSSTGSSTYGLYEGGIYSGGTEYGSFTVS